MVSVVNEPGFECSTNRRRTLEGLPDASKGKIGIREGINNNV
jgi:hypothetical protein